MKRLSAIGVTCLLLGIAGLALADTFFGPQTFKGGTVTFEDTTVKQGSLEIQDGVYLQSDISPSQITANQNDYNPSGLADAAVLRLSTDASRNLTGLQGGSDGRLLFLHNVGSNNLVVTHEDAASTAANRFQLPSAANITITAGAAVPLQYDSTSARWRLLVLAAGSGNVVGPASATANALARFDGATGKLIKNSPNLKWDGTIMAVTGDIDLIDSGGTRRWIKFYDDDGSHIVRLRAAATTTVSHYVDLPPANPSADSQAVISDTNGAWSYSTDFGSNQVSATGFDAGDGDVENVGVLKADEIQADASTITITPAAGSNLNVATSGAGNFAVNTTELVVDTGVGVGIGTATPGKLAHVFGGSSGATPASNTYLVVEDNSHCFLNVLSGDTQQAGIYLGNSVDGALVGRIVFNGFTNILGLGYNSNEHLAINSAGNVGIGTTSPTELLDVNADAIRVRTSQTPASASATGTAGMICWDANYIYVCVATNTWKRTAISTW